MSRDAHHIDGSPLVAESVLKAADVARIGIAISVLEATGSRCVYATATAAQMLGTPLEGLVGHSLRDFIAPADVGRLAAIAARLMANPSGAGGLVEVTAVRPDGTRFELQLAHAPTTVGDAPAVVSFLIDVGAQREKERSDRELAQRLAQIVEHTPDAVVVSRRGVILEANPAAARMLGVPDATALKGKSLSEYVSPEDAEVMRERMGVVARGESPGLPRVYRTRGGPEGPRLVEIASFALEYGGQPAIIAFGRDVTERERLQEQLARTDRLAALGTLAAGVAHEINNPLASLALNAEVVARTVARAPLGEADRKLATTALGELTVAVERMSAIVRDLTGFSRTSGGLPGPVDVAAVVEAALRVARHATRQRARVGVELSPAAPVQGDAGKLEQVVVNLVVNAAQAFPEGRPAESNVIDVRVFEADGRVVLEVADNGPGIPPEVLPHVFDPFFTTKPAGVGTGLGLFICHSVVTQLGGDITVDSELGRGATIRVSLAALAGRAHAAPAGASASAAPRLQGVRVLVVDDEPSLRRSLQYLLADHLDVLTAPGGEQALELLERDAGVEVVLCDLMMPGVTGRDLYHRLAKSQPGRERRIVFMTGGAFTGELSEFLEAVPNPRLQKPFTAEQVDAAISQVLRPTA